MPLAEWLSGNAFVSGAGEFVVQMSDRSNWTLSCQRLAIAATFLRMELCRMGIMTRKWTPQSRYTLRRNTACIIKDFV